MASVPPLETGREGETNFAMASVPPLETGFIGIIYGVCRGYIEIGKVYTGYVGMYRNVRFGVSGYTPAH